MITTVSQQVFASRSGQQVRVRPLLPEDVPYLVDLFENMSPESRYHRFLQPTDQLDIERIWAEAESITTGAAGETHGFIAFSDIGGRTDVPVAVARYVKIADSKAEMAVSVRDDVHNQGIGTALMRILVAHAAKNGMTQLMGMALNDNTAVFSLLGKLGYRLERILEGNSSEIILHLDEPGGPMTVRAQDEDHPSK